MQSILKACWENQQSTALTQWIPSSLWPGDFAKAPAEFWPHVNFFRRPPGGWNAAMIERDAQFLSRIKQLNRSAFAFAQVMAGGELLEGGRPSGVASGRAPWSSH